MSRLVTVWLTFGFCLGGSVLEQLTNSGLTCLFVSVGAEWMPCTFHVTLDIVQIQQQACRYF